jgi:sortase (surface protein transpeptidase)
VVLPTDVDVAFPTEDTRLTLITCTGWSDILQSYAQRVVVIARPLE